MKSEKPILHIRLLKFYAGKHFTGR